MSRVVRPEGDVLVSAYCEPQKPNLRWQVHALFLSFLDHAPAGTGFLVTIPEGTERYLDPRIPYRVKAPRHEQLRHPALSGIGFTDGYPFINHFLSAEDLSGRADHVLLTDCDTVLTPAFAGYEPEAFMVGQGAYYSDYSHARLAEFCRRHGFERFGRWTNVSATWFGETERVTACARETAEVIELLLHDEDWSETSWPKWWVGVLALYASEIVLNERLDSLTVRPGLVDGHCRSEPDELAMHLHMWHVGDPRAAFCKFSFERGFYDDEDVGLIGNAARLLDYARRGRALGEDADPA